MAIADVIKEDVFGIERAYSFQTELQKFREVLDE
jgi:hypothetical protein